MNLNKNWYKNRSAIIRSNLPYVGITRDGSGASHPIWILEGIFYVLKLNDIAWNLKIALLVDALAIDALAIDV